MNVFPVRIWPGPGKEVVISGRMLRIWEASTGGQAMGDLAFSLNIPSETCMEDMLALVSLGLIRMGCAPFSGEGSGAALPADGARGGRYGVYRGVKIFESP